MTFTTHFNRAYRGAEPYMARDAEFAREVIAAGGTASDCFNRFVEHVALRNLTPTAAQLMGKRASYVLHVGWTEQMRGLENPHHYQSMMDEADKVLRTTSLRRFGTDEDFISTIIMHYQQGSFEIAGKRIYEVTLGLALELLDTELRGIRTEDLQLPYETIYIAIPAQAGLKVYNAESDWHPLEGMYLTEDTDDNGERLWRFLLIGIPKPILIGDGVEFDNDALLHWRMTLPADTTLDDAVERCEREMTAQTCSESFKAFIPLFRETFRFAMNTVLYATMPEADVERIITNDEARKLFARIKKLPKGKKRDRLRERLHELPTDERFVLGRTITIDRTALAARSGTGTESAEARKLHVQFRRRGHFRNQPYGHDRALRKRIWIKPHWVGAKDKPLSASNYKLDLPEDPELHD